MKIRLKQRTYGFTLLEMIVVVVILSILSSIALPKYLIMAEKGRMAEAKSTLAALRDAQVRYMAQMEHFTNVLADLDTPPSGMKYFNVDITGTDTSLAAALNPNTEVATCVRNSVNSVNTFPANYVVNINQFGTISSTSPSVRQKLI